MKIPEWIGNIKVIGWDLDGTLYPANKDLGREITRLKFEKLAKVKDWSLEKTKVEYEKVFEKLGSHTKTLTEMGMDGVEFFVSLWDELDLGKFIKRDEKVEKMFDALSGRRHFLLSNSNTVAQIEKKLGLVGLDKGVFEFVISTVDVEAVKPDPKPFEVALTKLKLKAGEVMYVGDRVRTDIVGAKGVGMRTCLVWSSSDEADVSLPTVYDVVNLFE